MSGRRSSPAAAGAGWWRRNRYGLLALVPALLLAVGTDGYDFYRTRHDGQPTQPLTSAPGGWLGFRGARIRLTQFARMSGPLPSSFGGQPITVPAGAQVWRATVEFQVPTGADVGGCEMDAWDGADRLFSADPAEVAGAIEEVPDCAPDSMRAGAPAFTIHPLYLLPTSATPRGVRIVVPVALPQYARLLPG